MDNRPDADQPDAANLTVTEDADANRYDLLAGDRRVGLADYADGLDGTVTVRSILHVETDPIYRGQGFAAQLMAGIAADARKRSITLVPICPYAVWWMQHHPDTANG